MLNLEFLRQSLIISIALSTITCAFIQKTKRCFPNSKCIWIYSLIINIIVGVIFCITFTNITFPESLWIGLFSFIGADTIYKTLEGKLAPYSEIVSNQSVSIPLERIINKEEDDGKTNLSKH